MTPPSADWQAELRRQQALVAQIDQVHAAPLTPPLATQLQAPAGQPLLRGLQAYRANAAATAAQVLAASYPVLQAYLGADAWPAFSRAYWLAHPPERGDLAWAGAQVPSFVAADEHLAAFPYLADLARLEWAVSRAEIAADAGPAPHTWACLGEHEPQALVLDWAPGSCCLPSAWPQVSLWHAKHPGWAEGDRQAAWHQAAAHLESANTGAEMACVWREPLAAGGRVHVRAVPLPEQAFTAALLQGQSLGQALEAADASFAFEPWLLRAIQDAWVLGARCATPPPD